MGEKTGKHRKLSVGLLGDKENKHGETNKNRTKNKKVKNGNYFLIFPCFISSFLFRTEPFFNFPLSRFFVLIVFQIISRFLSRFCFDVLLVFCPFFARHFLAHKKLKQIEAPWHSATVYMLYKRGDADSRMGRRAKRDKGFNFRWLFAFLRCFGFTEYL